MVTLVKNLNIQISKLLKNLSLNYAYRQAKHIVKIRYKYLCAMYNIHLIKKEILADEKYI